MNFYLNQGAQQAYLRIGNLISDAGATAQIFAISDNPNLVFKKFRDQAEAREMEPKITQMVKTLPSDDLKEIGAGSLQVHTLAWPTHCVYANGEFAGFLMPYVNHEKSVSLNKLFSPKGRVKSGITEDLRWRVYVARNLVSVYKTLHDCGYFVVDTKPANIRTYIDTPAVSILDCDGFRHKDDSSSKGFITEEYIAPTSIGREFSELGGEQDLFAVSVLVFQILNNGIHPFQGIQSDSTAFNTQELIAMRAYAYGATPVKVLKPSPISCHQFFPDDLAKYFDSVFSGRSRAKTVNGLLAILDRMKNGEGLKACINPSHFSFQKGCPSCFLDNIASGSSISATKTSKPAEAPTVQQTRHTAKPTHVPLNPTQPRKPGNPVGWFALLGAVILGILAAVSESSRNSNVSTNNVSKSDFASESSSSSARTSNAFPAMDDAVLCTNATLRGFWDERPEYAAYVAEAKRRGLTCRVQAGDTTTNNNSTLEDDRVCYLATRNGSWDPRPEYQLYVNEAARRDLDCGVIVPSGKTAANANTKEPVVVAVALLDKWYSWRHSDGSCNATAEYDGGNVLQVQKRSAGNFNITYDLYIELNKLLTVTTKKVTFSTDTAFSVSYTVNDDIDVNQASVSMDRDFSAELGKSNYLMIHGDNPDLIFKFSLRGSNAALEDVRNGECS